VHPEEAVRRNAIQLHFRLLESQLDLLGGFEAAAILQHVV
jgi:hypothetical protein